MSDNYSHYTRLIKTYLGFHNSVTLTLIPTFTPSH